jgi:hypothetical protein
VLATLTVFFCAVAYSRKYDVVLREAFFAHLSSPNFEDVFCYKPTARWTADPSRVRVGGCVARFGL